MRWDSEFFEGVFDRHDDEKIPTTGTPLDVSKSASHKFLDKKFDFKNFSDKMLVYHDLKTLS